MSEPISFGELRFEVVSSMDEKPAAPDPETPFRMALLGDFSGRASRGLQSPGNVRPIRVDRDTLDEVMEKLGVEVHLSLADERDALVIKFAELEDFHPDTLFQRLEIFQALRTIRQELNDPETFSAAAARVRNWLHVEKPAKAQEASRESPPPLPPEKPTAGSRMSGGLLDQIVAESSGQPEPSVPEPARETEFDQFLKDIVAPYLVADEDPHLQQMVTIVDTAISRVMEAVLHHPEFQTVEATWRGVAFLVSRLETDDKLQLYLVDISKEELAAALNIGEDLRLTAPYKLFVEQAVETYGGAPWAVLAGNYVFEQSLADIRLLGRMAKIARQAGAPFIAAADARIIGCESLAATPDPADWRLPATPDTIAAWEMLRKLPEASYLGLALPRFLLRLPYGADTDAIDAFDFEEMTLPPEHSNYLWGNPAVACACLLGRAFSRAGWQLRPGEIQDIENLPLHIYKEAGESRIKPCGEVTLTQRAAEIMLDKGLMPLLSFLNQDMVRLARFQSIADPPTRLAGRWE